MNKLEKYAKKFVRHMFRTYKNKLYALALAGLGLISMLMSDDGTFMVFMMCLSIPMFFSDKNWIL